MYTILVFFNIKSYKSVIILIIPWEIRWGILIICSLILFYFISNLRSWVGSEVALHFHNTWVILG